MPMRIGVPITGGDFWHGGITYLEAFTDALIELPDDTRPFISLIITKEYLNSLSLFKNLFSLVDNFLLVGEISSKELQQFISEDSLLSDNPKNQKKIILLSSFLDIAEQIDIICPLNSETLPGLPYLSWMPDIQFIDLPHFFSDDDIDNRTFKLEKLINSKQPFLTSSNLIKKNIGFRYPGSAHLIKVAHFYSYIPKDVFQRNPISLLDKYNLPEKYIICCNQFWQHKRHDILFNAIFSAKETIHLVCTGAKLDYRNEDLFNSLLNLINTLGISSQIHLLGFIDRSDQLGLIRQSIAVVQPSAYEGWSTVLEDSRALAKPVIASDIEVHIEQEIPGAIYFTSGDSSSLAFALDMAYQSYKSGPNYLGEELAKTFITRLKKTNAEIIINICKQVITKNAEEWLHRGDEQKKLLDETNEIFLLTENNNKLEVDIKAKHTDLASLNIEIKILQDEIIKVSQNSYECERINIQCQKKIVSLDFDRHLLDLLLTYRDPLHAPRVIFREIRNFFIPFLLRISKTALRNLMNKLRRILWFIGKFRNLDLNFIKEFSLEKKATNERDNLERPLIQEKVLLKEQLYLSNNSKLAQIEFQKLKMTEFRAMIAEKNQAIANNLATQKTLNISSLEKEKIIENLTEHNAYLKAQLIEILSIDFIIKKSINYLSRIGINLYRDARNSLEIVFQKFKLRYFLTGLGILYQYSPKKIEQSKRLARYRLKDYPLKISIVTPSFNQGRFIESTITSILSQNYPNLEYFIQDGGSNDSTDDVVRRYLAKISHYECRKDDGQSHAINLGMNMASGQIMAWINSDDLLMPGSLNLVSDYFAQNLDVDVIYGNRIIIDSKGMQIGEWILPEHDENILSWADFIPQETLFWRKELWDKVSGIDESFKFAMDWDLILRFRNIGARFKRLPYFLGAFRVHAEQKTSMLINLLGIEEMNRIRLRELGSYPHEIEIGKNIEPYIHKHRQEYFVWRLKKGIGLE